jgi:hypothetical protein
MKTDIRTSLPGGQAHRGRVAARLLPRACLAPPQDSSRPTGLGFPCRTPVSERAQGGRAAQRLSRRRRKAGMFFAARYMRHSAENDATCRRIDFR